jgi:hypothetical protein
MAKKERKNRWVKASPGGGTDLRKGTKLLLAILPLVVATAFYGLLLLIEGLSNGREILIVLAYALIVLFAALVLLALMVSLSEYLRRFE